MDLTSGVTCAQRQKQMQNSVSFIEHQRWRDRTVEYVGQTVCHPVFVGICLAVSTKATIEEKKKASQRNEETLSNIRKEKQTLGFQYTHKHTLVKQWKGLVDIADCLCVYIL